MEPGEGVNYLDMVLSVPNPGTGKMWDSSKAVDELARISREIGVLVDEMRNVPDPVRMAITLLGMAVGTLAVEVRRLQRATDDKPLVVTGEGD
jgi:hypothetical protein